MTYIKFDKTKLINLEYSLNKELIRSNRAGSYASTTVIGANTRKYHGLLICPMEDIDGENHVLLSSLDISVHQQGAAFNLGVRKYPGIYEPKGHKYIRDFSTEPIPHQIFRVGGVVLRRENLLVEEDDRILIKITLLEAHSPTKLTFKPFLAFRKVHALSKANMFVNRKYKSVENGIKVKMYDGYKSLFMQFSKKAEYVHVPDWYYNVEYIEEQKRGYDFREDLFVPGYFELPLKKGESVVFSAGLSEINTKTISKKFDSEAKKRIPRTGFENCLVNSAQQFIVKRNKKTEIIAGFPWFGRWGRDTFIALPGLTLAQNDLKTCKGVLDTMSAEIKDGLFPNIGHGEHSVLNSVDAPLWYFWALQQYHEHIDDKELVWKDYGKKMKVVLNKFKEGTHFNIKMHDNGLIWSGEPGHALTWMDAVVHGRPVTPRIGFDVEINALWYNAVCFTLELAEKAGDKKFVSQYKNIPNLTKTSFVEMFWDEKKKYLADYATYEAKDWSIRPNQIFATSLPYSPINVDIADSVLETVRQVLLTTKGLRTLSPSHPDYIGRYEGSQEQRDNAYHQGTVWPWLLGHFAEGILKIHGKSRLAFVQKLISSFEEDMSMHGIGSISEVYDGDPPHNPNGAISQAWSVAEVLRMIRLTEKYKTKCDSNN
ncbi:MAG: glycogen debranching enzyme family protein [Bacteroidales bacterium]|nr:glycogen debranching enzyme family protein [Bacteroidales bacterium]